eukprot:CAMPEP_0167753612 /NCGR_PEP_ID=MMETSP0110_2-20121227/7813_1 /TAXON_ID=629695 /ORGANISM="Gymnochlora sp., Strain CCMP2014" /LENGTH=2584 /DNA_ID=CAMNT_0007639403 /DNA_START=9 /DNA_END=7763 /DNA_ORIENTATION=+
MSRVPEQTDECYENQRFWPTSGWTSALLPTDRYSWSSQDGKAERLRTDYALPAGWYWKVDETTDAQGWKYICDKNTDSEGWSYGFNFHSVRHSSSKGCFVRTRRWVRTRRVGTVRANSPPIELIARAFLQTFEMKTHSFGLFDRRKVKNCFKASEAVDWMIGEKYVKDKKEAIRVGQQLYLNGLFEGVSNSTKRFKYNSELFRTKGVQSSTSIFYVDKAKIILKTVDAGKLPKFLDDFLDSIIRLIDTFLQETSVGGEVNLECVFVPTEPLLSFQKYSQTLCSEMTKRVFAADVKDSKFITGFVDHAGKLFQKLLELDGDSKKNCNVYTISIAFFMLPEVLTLFSNSVHCDEKVTSALTASLKKLQESALKCLSRYTRVLCSDAVTDLRPLNPWLTTHIFKGGFHALSDTHLNAIANGSESPRKRRRSSLKFVEMLASQYPFIEKDFLSNTFSPLRINPADEKRIDYTKGSNGNGVLIASILENRTLDGKNSSLPMRVQRTTRRFKVLKSHGGAEIEAVVRFAFAAAVKLCCLPGKYLEGNPTKKASRLAIEIWRVVMRHITDISQVLLDSEHENYNDMLGEHVDIKMFTQTVTKRAKFLLQYAQAQRPLQNVNASEDPPKISLDIAKEVVSFCCTPVASMSDLPNVLKDLKKQYNKGLCRLAGVSTLKELTTSCLRVKTIEDKTIAELCAMIVDSQKRVSNREPRDLLKDLSCCGNVWTERIVASYLQTVQALIPRASKSKNDKLISRVLECLDLKFRVEFLPHIDYNLVIDFLFSFLPLISQTGEMTKAKTAWRILENLSIFSTVCPIGQHDEIVDSMQTSVLKRLFKYFTLLAGKAGFVMFPKVPTVSSTESKSAVAYSKVWDAAPIMCTLGNARYLYFSLASSPETRAARSEASFLEVIVAMNQLLSLINEMLTKEKVRDGLLEKLATHEWISLFLSFLNAPQNAGDPLKALFPYQLCQVMVLRIIQKLIPRSPPFKSVAMQALKAFLKSLLKRIGVHLVPVIPLTSAANMTHSRSMPSPWQKRGDTEIVAGIQRSYAGIFPTAQVRFTAMETLASRHGVASVGHEIIALVRTLALVVAPGSEEVIEVGKKGKEGDIENKDNLDKKETIADSDTVDEKEAVDEKRVKSKAESVVVEASIVMDIEKEDKRGWGEKLISEIVGEGLSKLPALLKALEGTNEESDGKISVVEAKNILEIMAEMLGMMSVLDGYSAPCADARRVQVKFPSGIHEGTVWAVHSGRTIVSKRFDLRLDGGGNLTHTNVSFKNIFCMPPANFPLTLVNDGRIMKSLGDVLRQQLTGDLTGCSIPWIYLESLRCRASQVFHEMIMSNVPPDTFLKNDWFDTLSKLALGASNEAAIAVLQQRIHLLQMMPSSVEKLLTLSELSIKRDKEALADAGLLKAEDEEQGKDSIDREVSPSPKETEWACATCTFIQPITNSSCVMCGAARVVVPKKKDYEVTCVMCTYINDLRTLGIKTLQAELKCSLCGSPLTLSAKNRLFIMKNGNDNNPFATEEKLPKNAPPPLSRGKTFLESDRGAVYAISVLGFPENWAELALNKAMKDTSLSIRGLLAEKEYLIRKKRTEWNAFLDGKDSSNRVPTWMREITPTKEEAVAPRKNPSFHILNHTWEKMVVSTEKSLDEKSSNISQPNKTKSTSVSGSTVEETSISRQNKSPRNVQESVLTDSCLAILDKDAQHLKKLGFQERLDFWISTQEQLTARFCKVCTVEILQQLATSSDRKSLVDISKQHNFIRLLMGFIRSSDNRTRESDPIFTSGVLSSFLCRALDREKKSITASEAKEGYLTWSQFAVCAPVSMELVVLVLEQLVDAFKCLHLVRGVKSKSDIFDNKLDIVTWVIDVFTRIVAPNESKGHAFGYYEFLFSSHIVNGIMGLIIASEGATRTDLMLLLASIHHMCKKVVRLSVSKSKRLMLQQFMFDMYNKQRNSGGNKRFSPFFQALVELNVSLYMMQKANERPTFRGHQAWFQDVLQVAECMEGSPSTRSVMNLENHANEVMKIADSITLQAWSPHERTVRLEDFLYVNNVVFTRSCDEEFVEFVNRIYIKKGSRKPTTVGELKLPPKEMVQFPSMQALNINTNQRRFRFFVLASLNQYIHTVLPLINLSLPPGKSGLADGIRSIRNIIFWSTKEHLWNTALRSTLLKKRDYEVNIDKIRALKCKEQKQVDFEGKDSVFGQLMTALESQSPRIFRIGPNERAFKVVEMGFNSQDIGGPYRDTIEQITNELQSSILPLFVPCYNAKVDVGRNRDVWVPRAPLTNNSIQRRKRLAMYEFVGKLMGLAVRSQNFHSFHFSGVIWKPLVWDQVTISDVSAIDTSAFKSMDNGLQLERRKVSKETFNKAMSQVTFTTLASNGEIVELVKNGARVRVTWENRNDYYAFLTRYKINEFQEQSSAMQRGLATIVPYQLLSLFTWRELQDQVCGRIVVDVKLLESMTKYAGPLRSNRGFVRRASKHISMFWKMMRERMDNFQRSKFLFFVWGRSRLPLNAKGFERNFTIMAHVASSKPGRNPDQYLPVAHTCFFQLELPEYSNVDIMYEKMMYACTHCTSIDGDNTRAAREAARRRGAVL